MWLAVVTTIVAGLVLVLVVLWRGGFGRGGGFRGVAEAKRNALLIVGVSGEGDDPSPGKTSLFFLLKTGNAGKLKLLTSMKVNEGKFPIAQEVTGIQGPIRVLDLPGHPRLKGHVIQFLPQARCVVLMVDAARLASQARRTAELLFDILVNPDVVAHEPPILIFANKSDFSSAISTAIVRIRLQNEMEQVRIARRSALDETIAGDRLVEPSMLPGHAPHDTFSFDKLPWSVIFDRGSVLEGSIQPIHQLITQSFS